MTEIRLYTTDQTFLDDLNAAGIEGVEADYRPEMAFDTGGTESILTVVITVGATAGLKCAQESDTDPKEPGRRA